MEADAKQNKRVEPIERLFVNWANGDSLAGEQMADRFDRWFDTLTTFYLGASSNKDSSYQAVCKIFSDNIQTIKKSRDLIPFAHQIISKEISTQNSPVADFTNAMLKDKPAASLLHSVWGGLSTSEQLILLDAYRNDTCSHPPYDVFCARQKLKTLLQKEGDVAFINSTTTLDRDLTPVAMYESQKLRNKQEIQYFEQWLLNAPVACQDILEFAPFVHALRNGAVAVKEAPKPVTPPQPEVTENDITDTIQPTSAPVSDDTSPPDQNNANDLLKPIIVAAMVLVVIVGLWIIVQSSS